MADIREVIRRFSDDAHGKGKVELIDELCHEDFVNHTAPEGVPPDREGEKAFVQMVHDALSDMESTTERILVDGDQVAWRWRARARHTGEFMGVPPSGNEVEVTGNDIGIMRDGKLAELWAELDMLSVMTQLGAIEPPTG